MRSHSTIQRLKGTLRPQAIAYAGPCSGCHHGLIAPARLERQPTVHCGCICHNVCVIVKYISTKTSCTCRSCCTMMCMVSASLRRTAEQGPSETRPEPLAVERRPALLHFIVFYFAAAHPWSVWSNVRLVRQQNRRWAMCVLRPRHSYFR
jgi:hypothetical protein